jgi:hypothetical protein
LTEKPKQIDHRTEGEKHSQDCCIQGTHTHTHLLLLLQEQQQQQQQKKQMQQLK